MMQRFETFQSWPGSPLSMDLHLNLYDYKKYIIFSHFYSNIKIGSHEKVTQLSHELTQGNKHAANT